MNEKPQQPDHQINLEKLREEILNAMLLDVAFDGWSQIAFENARKRVDLDAHYVDLAFPRGALDVAVYMHQSGDAKMVKALDARNEGVTSMTQKIENAINLRLKIANEEKEAVRAASSLFALPSNLALGSSLIWGTADAIWNALGDDASGFSHYSKRASLSAVYSSALLYFLQDQGEDMGAVETFVARRIADVGNFGKFTAKLGANFKRKPA